MSAGLAGIILSVVTTLKEKLTATGIRRVGSVKSGFVYRYPDGRKVSAAERARIQKLAIPPAWRDVAIAPEQKARLQVVGVDARGRVQYRYHPSFLSKQQDKKYQRLLAFAQALPKLRKVVRRDIRRPGLGRERVMACILRILSCCFIRAGSEAYARENGSYGIATLRPKHVKLRGDHVHFEFPGKSGQKQVRDIKDRQVAQVIRELLKVPGRDIFKFINEDGEVIDVRRRHINGYIKETMGEAFSAKDFRTWAGTLICACSLARVGTDPADTPRLLKKKVVAAIKETALQLGNTPAVCRASYIYPPVLGSFEKGRMLERYFETVEELAAFKGHGLHASEEALLKLVQSGATCV
ncbi:MAG TPA: DNA topoisomerase IB [Myxococcaceae bacterium]|nr:DNA topoisomerase IB [Myxococcaceae bacterium]